MANKKKSSSSKYQKKAVKTVTKAAKKNPKVFIIVVLVLALLIGAGLAVYFFVLKDKLGPKGDSSSSEPTSSQTITSSHNHDEHYDPKITTPSGISINFLELGSWYTGDSTFIKAGDVDILIDAGSKNTDECAKAVKDFILQPGMCTDGKLEYVIVTHAHEDHIAGFVGTKSEPGIFESFKIGTLIDFSLTNQSVKTKAGNTSLYGEYVEKRDAAIANGDIEHHYTAAECVDEIGGAKKEYTINDSVKMTVLDQKYYKTTHSKENNYSVCTLFTHNTNNYLFTGDLEGVGEKSLVELNDLPHCQLFKGGHHGSDTSSTDILLNKITPEVICICCCAGSSEYTKTPANQFPYQEAIDRMAKHTEQIFVTTVSTNNDEKTFASLNGNICFKSEDGKTYTVAGSNNSIILKETEWFKNNRTWPTA